MSESERIGCRVFVDGRPAFCRILSPASGSCAGLPLLCIHGLGCSSEVWIPAFAALQRLGAERLVLAPDMPGYGHSEGPVKALDIDELADWVVRLMDRLDLPAAHFAAHSLGCQVALAIARRHPARARALILVGPTLGSQLVPVWRYVVGLLIDCFLEKMLYNGLLAKMYCEMGVLRYAITTCYMFADCPLDTAGSIAAPALILRGKRDAIVPDTAARRLTAALPNGQFERVAGTAHAVPFNRAEFFAARTSQYLSAIEQAGYG